RVAMVGTVVDRGADVVVVRVEPRTHGGATVAAVLGPEIALLRTLDDAVAARECGPGAGHGEREAGPFPVPDAQALLCRVGESVRRHHALTQYLGSRLLHSRLHRRPE